MEIDILPIRDDKGNSMTYDFTGIPESTPETQEIVSFTEPVHVSGTIFNLGESFLLNGKLSGTVRVVCDRCLDPYDFDVESDMDYEFVSSYNDPHPKNRDVEGDLLDESDLRRFHGNKIDISNEVRETVLLSLPHKLICNEKCKGICPNCGANRNKTECGCSDESDIDPRFAKLKDLFKDK